MRAWSIAILVFVCGCQPQSSVGVEKNNSATLMTHRVQPARRIVSLAPGITEMLYAIDAQQWLVATVEYSDFPEAAKQIPRVGDAFRIDLERLLAFKPDLVLVWSSGTPYSVVSQIKALGLRVESIDANRLGDVSNSLRRLGELTGQQSVAEQQAHAFDESIDELRMHYQQRPSQDVFIEISRQPLYTVSGSHVISDVVTLCGGRNVFATLSQLAPVVSLEAVLKTNPDMILFVGDELAAVQQDWQQWQHMKAVKKKSIYAVSADTTTRAAPRLLAGARDICLKIEQARSKS